MITHQLDFSVAVSTKFRENTTFLGGLLGIINNNPHDDLTAPDGTVLNITTASEEEIFFNFGEKCMYMISACMFVVKNHSLTCTWKGARP